MDGSFHLWMAWMHVWVAGKSVLIPRLHVTCTPEHFGDDADEHRIIMMRDD